MSAELPPLRSAPNPPVWRDVRVLRWVGQIAVVAVVLGFLFWLYSNASTNLRTSGLPTGFDFLFRDFRAAIPGIADAADFPIWRAFLAGYINTVRVILLGIPLCTILGISTNWIVRKLSTIYVETFRNVPVLIWIFFAHFVVSISILPPITEASTPFNTFVLSNRGVGIPWFNQESNAWLFMAFVGLGLLTAALVAAWRGKVNERTGQPARGGLFGIIAFPNYCNLITARL